MKNPNDTIGNRTRDLPTCSAVPQPTALPRAALWKILARNREEVTGIRGMKHVDNLAEYRRDDLTNGGKMDRASTTYGTKQKLHIKFW